MCIFKKDILISHVGVGWNNIYMVSLINTEMIEIEGKFAFPMQFLAVSSIQIFFANQLYDLADQFAIFQT